MTTSNFIVLMHFSYTCLIVRLYNVFHFLLNRNAYMLDKPWLLWFRFCYASPWFEICRSQKLLQRFHPPMFIPALGPASRNSKHGFFKVIDSKDSLTVQMTVNMHADESVFTTSSCCSSPPKRFAACCWWLHLHCPDIPLECQVWALSEVLGVRLL